MSFSTSTKERKTYGKRIEKNEFVKINLYIFPVQQRKRRNLMLLFRL